ncbi:MAG: electron transfer flavoprotein subunit beta/FixA family protein [Proteobacteria bacterium]|nr:electron transfer flavoprotein subunit beta/FixA family protein [Pseudomonadota bacterium]
MKILVPIKRVLDPDLIARIPFDADARALRAAPGDHKPNTFDEYAVETALRILEITGVAGEVILVSIGDDAVQDALRQCLALGAHQAIHIRTENNDTPHDATSVAALLAALAQRLQPNIIILGKQASDHDAAQVPAMLSQRLALPGAFNLSQLDLAADARSATCHCGIRQGTLRLRVAFPAVLSVDLRIVSPRGVRAENNDTAYPDGLRFAALRQVMAAKKKPIQTLTPAELGLGETPLTRITGHAPPEAAPPCRMLDHIGALPPHLLFLNRPHRRGAP